MECWYALVGITSTFNAMGTVSPAVDVLNAIPFMSGRGGTIDRLGFEVTAFGGANSKARVGIYTNTNDSTLYPKTLVVDGGNFDTSSVGGNGVKATTLSQVLQPNTLYWAVYLAGTAAPQIRGITGTGAWGILGYTSAIGATVYTELTVAQAYGNLPSTFPGSAAVASVTIPMIVVRYSA